MSIIDDEGCYVALVGKIDAAEISSLVAEVEALRPESRPVVIRGITKQQPRLVKWLATAPDMEYAYSGLKLMPTLFPPALEALRTQLVAGLASDLPTCLINVYRNGHDSVGQHSDNERVLGDDPTIVSVSIGASRTFRLMHRYSKRKIDVRLADGDVLVMAGATQRRWLHEIPKEPRVTERRVNLTFRPYVR